MSTPWAGVTVPAAPLDEWAPAGVLPAGGGGQTLYASVEEWVAKWLTQTYRRPVAGQHRIWCAQWWSHPEALDTLGALWLAWETARDGSGAERCEWWLTAHALMDRLFDPNGPFHGCSAKQHRDDALPPLAVQPSPLEGLQAPGADPAPGP